MRHPVCPECQDDPGECESCGRCWDCCECDDCEELFDADELGLDPEKDDTRRYGAKE